MNDRTLGDTWARARTVRWLLAAVLTVAAPTAGSARAPLGERVSSDSLLFLRAIAAQRFDSVLAAVRQDIPTARAFGERRALALLLRLQGVALAMSGSGRVAAAPLDEALALSRSQGDTAQALVALRWRTYVAGMLGDYAQQEALAAELLEMARARRDERFQSVALNFSGWLAMRRGDLARARSHLEQAIAVQRRLRLEDDEAIALTTLANVLLAQGELDRARAAYARQLEIAGSRKLTWSEAQALNGLGSLEMQSGDPALAAIYFQRAREIHCGAGETYDCAVSLLNIASTELGLGRPGDAVSLANEGLALATRRGYARLRAPFAMQVARAELERGRLVAARRACDVVRALGDTADAETRTLAAIGIAHLLGREARFEEAVTVERDALARWGADVSRGIELSLRVDLLGSIARAGRADEVIASGPALARSAESAGLPWLARVAWQNTAFALWRDGRKAEAARTCDEVLRTLELERAGSVDPAWRERMGGIGATAAIDCAGFLLDDPAAATDSIRQDNAFSASQRVRARTLIERMSGPRGTAMTPSIPGVRGIGLADLQRGVLAEGELLLEWETSRSFTLLFAITRDTRRVVRLPGTDALADSIALALGVLAANDDGDVGRAAADAVGRSLAHVLLGGCEDLVSSARTLIIVPDGPLHRVPFAALSAGDGLLIEAHEIAVVPSGQVLADLRRGASQVPAGRGMLAFDSGQQEDGPVLRGARREVGWLSESFEGVERGSAAPAAAPIRAEDLTRFDALHFAGHTRLDDRSPWRSGIVLRTERAVGAAVASDTLAARKGRGTRQVLGNGADAGDNPAEYLPTGYLTAEHVAQLPLAARLVVLASCQSGGGAVRAGEGLAGLSTAFLAGGTRAVVATLWPVDDAVTETLMRAFYRRLAHGETVSAALRGAQVEVRSAAATRHPYYWAGFVLIGEGGIRLPLRPRGLRGDLLLRSVLVLLAIAAAGMLLVRLRGERPGGPV